MSEQFVKIGIVKPNLPEMEDILEGFESSVSLPGYLRIQIIDLCNERCFFCHNEGSLVEGRTIDENVMLNSINASFGLGKTRIGFTGGEPTLHPKLADFVRTIKRENPGSTISLTTNGTRLNRLPRNLYGPGGLDKIAISIHSLQRERYKEITKRDYLSLVLNNLEELLSSGFSGVSLNMVVNTDNLEEVRNMALYCQERNINLKILDIIGDSDRYASFQKVEAIIEGDGHSMVERGIVSYKPKVYHPKCYGCESRDICGEGDYLRLSVDGKLMPCLYRPDLELRISPLDKPQTVKRKIALGFRRIKFDDM
ncbi:MAG: radical SAM protein [Nanoarchaeota archaeon]